MATPITTTIRWNHSELEDIKQAADQVGLPVALFLKSLALSRIRLQRDLYSPELTQEILIAKKQAERGEVETFTSAKSFLKDLRKHAK